jgi:hypothetical protein
MNEDLNETKNLAYLEVFKSYFSGISHLFEKSKDLPLSVLVLVLKKDATDRDRTLNLSFLPFDDDDLNQINPLQFYSILPINYNGDREDVNNLILKLNQFSAIGGFSINNNNEIILRYIHCIPRFEIYQKESLEEVINLFVKNMDVLGSKIESCINGNLSSEEIISNLI